MSFYTGVLILNIIWVASISESFKSVYKSDIDKGVYNIGIHGLVHSMNNTKAELVYTRNMLLNIGTIVNNIKRLNKIQADVWNKIRQFRINKTKRGNRGGRRHRKRVVKHQNGINVSNLTVLKEKHRTTRAKSNKVKAASNKSLSLCCLNAQSIKKKELPIIEYLLDENIDFCVISETWLKESDNDWLKQSEFNRNGYKIFSEPRKDRSGGGLALIYCQTYKVAQISSGCEPSFQHATWNILHKGLSATITGIYHPPYSQERPITNSQFIDEFGEFIPSVLGRSANCLIVGDFNIHTNDDENPDSFIFNEMLEALGLVQHIQFSTHKYGNTLDQVITKCDQSLSVATTSRGPAFSDHYAVHCRLNLIQADPEIKVVKSRNLKSVDVNKLGQDIQNKLLNLDSSLELDLLTECIENCFKETLDQHAPEKTHRITVRHKYPWYNNSIIEQKRIMRKAESVWRQYGEDHQWIAYKVARNKYNMLLYMAKVTSLSQEVISCDGNTKKLYNLIKNITGQVKENPLPDFNNTKGLCDSFLDFFMDKIHKIRDELSSHS